MLACHGMLYQQHACTALHIRMQAACQLKSISEHELTDCEGLITDT